MQNTKDTFYEVIRGRLAAANPARKVVVRGATRPGLLVEENELPLADVAVDCFRLRWTDVTVRAAGALPLVQLSCEVLYETAGTALGGRLDRGRSLAAMDAELLAAVTTLASRALKMSYAGLGHGGSAVGLLSSIWWDAPVFWEVENRGERLGRTAIVTVMSYVEAGEM